ncbi:HAD domain-containing protein [Noviherbaspirillum malthae]|uniref:HAD domain-containing protein n=1 Tax=Noviherbaspirillum malthae TaxID=1260987 RepID=UPI00188F4924|nr:HAD domain-containing protein [Noviherbaspirillum malthae]
MTVDIPERIVLAVDFDGVTHSVTKEIKGMDRDTEELRVQLVRGTVTPASLGLLCEDKQQLLAEVLMRHRHVDVVLSSAWRSWEGFNFIDHDEPEDILFELRHVHTLDWVKRLLLPVISSRLIGATGFDGSRIDQIRAFVGQLDPAVYRHCWVAIDDQVAHFPTELIAPFYREDSDGGHYDVGVARDEVVVLIDGVHGLTAASAQALDAAIVFASSCPDFAGQHPERIGELIQ